MVLGCAATGAMGQLCFEERVVITSLFDPQFAVVADVDQDGDLDIISTSGQTPSMQSGKTARIVWYENDGGSVPEFTERFLGNAPFDLDVFVELRVADFNGDGYPDLFANLGGGEHFWFQNNGAPSFGFTRRSTGWGGQSPRFFADLDGDGDTDLVQDNSRWFRYTGTGSTHFQQVSFNISFNGTVTGAADLNGDGDLDLLAIGGFWYESDGGTSPQYTARPLMNGGIWRAIDLDGDTDLDLLSGSTFWLRNNLSQSGSFQYVLVSSAVAAPLTPADLDQDGFVDFVDADQTWWRSLLGSSYVPQEVHPAANGPFTVRDIDGDGDADLLDADGSTWYRNNLDEFGNVSFSEEGFVGLNDGSTPRLTSDSLHDFNGDGDLDPLMNREGTGILAWFNNSTMENTGTGARFGSLIAAIQDALDGDTLIGDPGIFECAADLNLFDRNLDVRSRGDLYAPSTIMFNRGSMRAGVGSDAFFDTLTVGSSSMGGFDVPSIVARTVVAHSVIVEDLDIVGDLRIVPGAFLNPRYSATVGGIKQIRTGDIDRDGDQDTIVLKTNGFVSWFEHTPSVNASWDGIEQTIFPVTAVSESIEVGDINNDGFVDIIAHDEGEIFLMLNNGGGEDPAPFTLQTVITGLFFGGDIAVGDLDNDGDLDIIHGGIGSKSGGSVRLLTNNGANPPSFAVSPIYSPRYFVNHIDLVDLEGDGDLDVLMAEEPPFQGESGIVVLRNNGSNPATFSGSGLGFYVPTIPTRVYGADFDGDGDSDILALYPGGFSPRIMLLENQHPGFGFSRRVVALGDDLGSELGVADFDNDGDIDFVTGESVYYENTGSFPARFRRSTEFSNGVSGTIHASAFSFFEDAESVDLVRSDPGSGTIVWVENEFGSVLSPGFETVLGVTGDVDLTSTTVYLPPDGGMSIGGSFGFDRNSSVFAYPTTLLNTSVLINAGTLYLSDSVSPGSARTTIPGDYQQFETSPDGEVSGLLRIDMGPSGSTGGLEVLGTAALAGGLVVPQYPFGDITIAAGEPIGPIIRVGGYAPGRDRFDVVSMPIVMLDDGEGGMVQGTVLPTRIPGSGNGAAEEIVLVPVTLDELLFSQNAFGSQGTPNDAVLADVTGASDGSPDGEIDLVVAIPEIDGVFPSGAVAVFQGSLTVNGFEMVTLDLYTGPEVDAPVAVEVGYFDGDPIPEIAFANSGANGNNNDVHFLRMDSSLPNPFIPAPLPSIGIGINLVVKDLATDDVIPMGFGPEDILVGVQSNTGGGSVLAVAFDDSGWESCEVDVDDVDTVIPSRPSSVARGPVLANVVVSSPGSDTITYFLNTGDFEQMVPIVVPTGTRPTEVVSGDLNLDGADDLVVICEGSGSIQGVITVSRNLGNDTFAPPVNIAIGTDPMINPSPDSIALSDVDDDGDLDVVLVSVNDADERVVRVIRNTSVMGGTISFASITDSPNQPAGVPAIVRSADLDGDSPLIADDIVVLVDPNAGVPRLGSPSNSIDLSGGFCPADLFADGELDFFDVSAFLSALLAEDPIADFTQDGEYDFFDVSAFLAAFMDGCDTP
jgi:hypothetical protein